MRKPAARRLRPLIPLQLTPIFLRQVQDQVASTPENPRRPNWPNTQLKSRLSSLMMLSSQVRFEGAGTGGQLAQVKKYVAVGETGTSLSHTHKLHMRCWHRVSTRRAAGLHAFALDYRRLLIFLAVCACECSSLAVCRGTSQIPVCQSSKGAQNSERKCPVQTPSGSVQLSLAVARLRSKSRNGVVQEHHQILGSCRMLVLLL